MSLMHIYFFIVIVIVIIIQKHEHNMESEQNGGLQHASKSTLHVFGRCAQE